MRFTYKQQQFMDAYVAKRNATQAAIAAGYSEQTAHVQGPRLLHNVAIKEEIERRIGDHIDRYAVTADRVIREMAKLAFGNIDDFIAVQEDGQAIIDLSTATREQLASLTSIDVEEFVVGRGNDAQAVKKVRIKLSDKQKALMDLAKIMQMLPAERREISGPNGGPLQTQVIGQPIDVAQLEPEQREQLKQILFAAKRLDNVTDVKDENDDDA